MYATCSHVAFVIGESGAGALSDVGLRGRAISLGAQCRWLQTDNGSLSTAPLGGVDAADDLISANSGVANRRERSL